MIQYRKSKILERDSSTSLALKCLIFKHFTVSPEDVSLTYKIFAKILQGVNMTKNIMSIAAAAALLTSGASAFETNATGSLLNIYHAVGDYQTGGLAPATEVVEADLDLQGDTLIFPAFNQKDDWGTEIVVRNNHNYAVVAKLVAYSGVDSQELRDFNIYLSANDVFRCTIKNGLITTSDDSVHTGQGWGVLDNITIPEDTGYISVYAMAAVTDLQIHTPEAAAKGLQDPKETLRQIYYTALDTNRPAWEDHAMEAGVFVADLLNPAPMASPKIMIDAQPVLLCDGLRMPENGCPNQDDVSEWNLANPNELTLSGTVRIYNTDRDLMMPATAVNNYTVQDGFIMLWAPKELAAFADRNLYNAGDLDLYNRGAIADDSIANSIDSAWYTFNNATVDASDSADLANKLVLTQPQKRTLIQTGQPMFWQPQLCEPAAINEGTSEALLRTNPLYIDNGSTYGLVYGADVWDEAEDKDVLAQDPEVSPGGSGAHQKVCNEVGEIANIEADTAMAEKNGYAFVRFYRGAPAIISQMTASETGGVNREINWINVPFAPFQQP